MENPKGPVPKGGGKGGKAGQKGDYKGKTFVTYDNLNFEDFPLAHRKKTMQISNYKTFLV